jgi:hypothetical protein
VAFQDTETGFSCTNDVSNKSFNPVINRIVSYMAKKEEAKQTSDPKKVHAKKLSFLSVTNLWKSPQSPNIFSDRTTTSTTALRFDSQN